MTHELKVWAEYFNEVATGKKPFEVRKNDRNFKENDILFLREWNNETKEYTGRSVQLIVTYILHGGQFGIARGYVVMGLQKRLVQF